MNEPIHVALPDESWADDFVRAIRQQRSHVQEYLAGFRERHRSAQAELAAAIRQWDASASRPSPTEGDASPAQQTVLLAERDQLTRQLSAVETRLAEVSEQLTQAQAQLAAAPLADARDAADGEYHRRYEMALDDLREMKTRNEELERQLHECSSAAAAAPATTGKALDWESEKRRILAALEAECDDGSESKEKRIEVQEVVRTTGRIVAEREEEIAELKRLLENQSANLGSMAVGAAAVGAILDQDAIVQEERENLRRMQSETDEKLRKAEIEISIERAKLARDRAEIDEKVRALGGHEGKPDDPGDSGEKGGKAARGRWLSRLGLKDTEDAK